MRLVERNTPLGSVLVAVDDENPDPVEPAGEVAQAVEAEGSLLDTLRTKLRRLAPGHAPGPDDPRERVRLETQELMDKADAMLDDLFADYVRRMDAADAETPAAVAVVHDVEPTEEPHEHA